MRKDSSRVCLALIALLVLLAACGERSQPEGRPAHADYFPMVPGTRWLYSLRSPLGPTEVEVTARGEMPLPQGRGQVFVMEEKNLGPSLGFAELAPVGYVVKDGYVGRITGIDYDASGRLRMLGQNEPTWILPLDPQPGQGWSQQNAIFQTPEDGGGHLGWNSEVKSRAPLTVPAGRFEDVVEVETVYHDPTEGEAAEKVVYRDYYARGVGLVRSVTESPSGKGANVIEQVLLEYHPPR